MIFNVFFRLWRIIATILLTANLMFCYISLPESVAYVFANSGKPLAFTGKQSFFYWTAGIIFFLNIGTLFLKNALDGFDFKGIFPNSQWAKSSESLKLQVNAWFNAFLALINTYLLFVILGLNSINQRKDQSLDFDYNQLLMGGIVILLILMFYLPLRLLFSNPPAEK
jgi:hypothetical protein